MKLFSRKSETSNLPPEIQQYYKTDEKKRVYLAWAVAIVSLIATLSIVLGLFFGIRALIGGTNDNNQTETQTTNQPAEDNAPANNDQTETPPSTQDQDQQSAVVDQQAPPVEQASPVPTTAQSPPPTPSTNDTQKKMPDTGPGETLAVFVGVTFAGYLLSLWRKKSSLKK